MFSTCFRRLFLCFPVFPHSVHLWSFWPSSAVKWSMYPYSCLSSFSPATPTENNDKYWSIRYIWLLVWLNVFIKQISCGKGHFAEFALVCEWAGKMDVFNVHPQIASGWSSFPTNGTTVHIWSHLWIGHNILIQQLVTTCKSRMCSITLEMRPWTFCTLSSRGCSVLFLCQIPPDNICKSIWMIQGSVSSPRASSDCHDHFQSFHTQCTCEL